MLDFPSWIRETCCSLAYKPAFMPACLVARTAAAVSLAHPARRLSSPETECLFFIYFLHLCRDYFATYLIQSLIQEVTNRKMYGIKKQLFQKIIGELNYHAVNKQGTRVLQKLVSVLEKEACS